MKHDQIFTPDYIVTNMLDDIGYAGDNVTKRILEPSFGDGAFLVEIVSRILTYAQNESEAHQLLDRVHGCEIDPVVYDRAIIRLNALLTAKGYAVHNWTHLVCGDALSSVSGEYDYIVGNPPYIRIHDLDADTRRYIAENYTWGNGMTDLYVIFFEMGTRHLAHGGEMIFIAPNSWLTNASQKRMREELRTRRMVHSITDYHALPVFGKTLTYPAITHLVNAAQPTWTYTRMETVYQSAWSRTVTGDFPLQQLRSAADEQFLRSLSGTPLGDICCIQNGVSTNADKCYVCPCEPRGPYLRPCIKGSTLERHSIIFPYEWTGSGYRLLSEERLKREEPELYAHLLSHKERLISRDIEHGAQWYQYARSQGIQQSRHRKFVVKHIISKDANRAEFAEVSQDCIVYGGIYIVVKDDANTARVRTALASREFCRYLQIMGKDKAGGYKEINTAILKSFPVV